MFTSLSPSSFSITSRSRGAQAQSHAQAPPSPSPFAFPPSPESLYADPWHAQSSSRDPSTSIWSPGSHPSSTYSSSSSSEQSSPTPLSPDSEHEHEPEPATKKHKKSTNTNSNSNSNNNPKSKSKRSKNADAPQKMVMGKTGKPILAASLKRQLRRQKARARAEPRYIELADGQKLGLGQRRSKYTAILEKLNQDLARVQNELAQEKQRNQHLDQTVQQLSQQLHQQSPPSPSTKLQSYYHTASQINSQLMHQHSTQTIYDFFKMSSPVMLVLLDFNLRVLDANATFLRENGWTRDELIGRRLPIIHMCMFFIPGYDPKQIPIDENDIPPLHGGLPRGIAIEQMHANPVNCPAYHNLYRGKAESITIRDTYLDGKGRLYKSAITHWLAYHKPEDENNNTNSNLPADTARFASDPHTLAMRSDSDSGSGSGSASSYIYSRPTTKADEAFRDLFGKPNPPYLPHKGYPKYHVAMESAYDREYLTPISLAASSSASSRALNMWGSSPSGRSSGRIREADSESDSDHDHDDEHIHQQHNHTHVVPWTDTTQPLHTIAKIADQFTAWRRTLRTNRASAGTYTSTLAIGINSPSHPTTICSGSTGTGAGAAPLTCPVSSSSSSSSSSCLDDDIDEDLVLPSSMDMSMSMSPACAPSDACAIVSVLVQKAKKVTSIRKMVKKEELEQPVTEEDQHHQDYGKSTTHLSIATIETNKTNTSTHNHNHCTATNTPQQPSRQQQQQVPLPLPISVPVSVPVHAPLQTSHQPSTPFPPSPSPYSPLDLPLPLPLSLPTPPSSSSSSSSIPPSLYDSDPDQDMWFPPSSSLTLTSQSSYESQTRTTVPFRAPSPFSIWGN